MKIDMLMEWIRYQDQVEKCYVGVYDPCEILTKEDWK